MFSATILDIYMAGFLILGGVIQIGAVRQLHYFVLKGRTCPPPGFAPKDRNNLQG